MKTFSTYFKTFLAAMLLLVGSNYVGAAEPNWTDYAVVPEVGKNYYIYNKTRGRFICFNSTIKLTKIQLILILLFLVN